MAVGEAVAADAPMSGGMMGNGTWYGAAELWWPTLLALTAFGAVLFVLLRVKK